MSRTVTDIADAIQELRTGYSMLYVQGTLHVGSRSLYGLTDLYRISYGDLYFLWYKFTYPHVKAMCEAIGNTSVPHISG